MKHPLGPKLPEYRSEESVIGPAEFEVLTCGGKSKDKDLPKFSPENNFAREKLPKILDIFSPVC